MKSIVIKIADIYIKIHVNIDDLVPFFDEYIIDDNVSPDFEVHATAELINQEKEDFILENQLEKNTIISEKVMEKLVLHRLVSEKLIDYDLYLMHGSAIAQDNKCYIFTAPSKTGKSTHIRLWKQLFNDSVFIVNDDKPYLKLEDNGEITVYGSPWTGKERYGLNTHVPLGSICEIKQAKENTMKELLKMDSFLSLYPQFYRSDDMEKADKIINFVQHLCQKYPIYQLQCNMDKEAAILSHKVMTEID